MKQTSLIFLYFLTSLYVAAQRGNLQCGQITHAKRTILENPASLPHSCQYTFEAFSAYSCQLLIQFERFSLQQPKLRNGILECEDRFTVGEFILCGENAAQHLYIPLEGTAYNSRKSRVVVNFELPNRWTETHWRLVITQLECPYNPNNLRLSNLQGFPFLQNLEHATRTLFSSTAQNFEDLKLIAPRGCSQYFTLSTGRIRSFNFNAFNGTLYLPNMNYVICVKAPAGAKKIAYTFEKFSMSIENISRPGFDLDCHGTIHTAGRRSDFLMIPQSRISNLPVYRPTHYCGRSLENLQMIASIPFLIYFQSDEQADPTETGFVISYSVE